MTQDANAGPKLMTFEEWWKHHYETFLQGKRSIYATDISQAWHARDAEIAAKDAHIKELEAERDNQYDENVAQIAKYAALEAERESLSSAAYIDASDFIRNGGDWEGLLIRVNSDALRALNSKLDQAFEEGQRAMKQVQIDVVSSQPVVDNTTRDLLNSVPIKTRPK